MKQRCEWYILARARAANALAWEKLVMVTHNNRDGGLPAIAEAGWRKALGRQSEAPYFKALSAFLGTEIAAKKTIYPDIPNIFAALERTPLDRVRVVILGQDPYHGPGQAHGLSFSVPPGEALPPSLRNIFKELHADLGLPIPRHGNLGAWADQGVLLLNSVLTVEAEHAGSHAGRGWEEFTDEILRVLNARRQGLVFLLWGAYAQRKGKLIDETKHLVLKSAHPSPLSAHRGFFGSRPFSKINAYLEARGERPIDWRV
jgi:uracil-DNA glycosylase